MARVFAVAALIACGWALSTRTEAEQAGGEEARVKKLIVQLIEDKDSKKRLLALFDLEVIGPRRFEGILQAVALAMEKDAEATVRVEAALALGRMGEDGKDAVPVLAKVLRGDKDERVRQVAARSLLQMMPHAKKALQALVEALEDSSGPTRAAAAEAIKALGEEARSAAPRLLEYVVKGKGKKEDAPARMYAVLALGRIGRDAPKTVPALAAVLGDSAEGMAVREAAAESLARYGVDAQIAAKSLAAALADTKNDGSLRLASAKALAKVEGDAATVWPALRSALGDSDAKLRLHTARTAGPYGKDEPEVIKVLARVAKSDDNVEVRLAAIQELGSLGPTAKDAQNELRYVLDHDDRELVRQYAEAALKKILDN
jgi:hypothetical protein